MSVLPAPIHNFKTRLRDDWRAGAVGAASAAVLGLLFLMSATLGGGLKNLSYDLPFVVTAIFPSLGPTAPTNEVLMVYMDDPSHRELNQPWLQPWDRSLHARLIDVLAAAGARAVAFDVLFDKPGLNDARLIQAAASYKRAVFGAVFEIQSHAGVELGRRVNPPFEELRRVAAWGVAEAADSDRTIRQHFRGDSTTPTLAWRVAEVARAKLPPNPFDERWVNYYGPPGSLPHRSFIDVLNTNFPPGAFSNKVVFVGALYNVGFTGGKGTDDFRTPHTRWYDKKRSPGAEINAIAYLNLARGDWLKELSPITEFLLVLLAGIALGFGLLPWRPAAATALSAALFALLAGMACLLVWKSRVWFPWLTVGLVQLPVALSWSLLVNIKRLYREKAALEEKLATAVGGKGTLLPIPTREAQEAVTNVTATGPTGAPPIPNHEMLSCIGKGAYGEVWLARDEIGTYHAVKIIHRKSFSNNTPYDREFRGIQQYTPISRTHPGLVHILHVGRNNGAGYFFYIMELGDCEVNGQKIDPATYSAKNLARELDRLLKLPARDCIQLAIDLAEALHYLHSQSLIHRDIKPSNIIWVNGAPKFADVGLVTHIAEKGRDVTYLGTEGFIAPEGPGTPAADVYSLGKVIYEAAMGRAASQYPDLPTTLTARVDQNELLKLNTIILKACEPDLRIRYKSAAEFKIDLAQLKRELYGDGTGSP